MRRCKYEALLGHEELISTWCFNMSMYIADQISTCCLSSACPAPCADLDLPSFWPYERSNNCPNKVISTWLFADWLNLLNLSCLNNLRQHGRWGTDCDMYIYKYARAPIGYSHCQASQACIVEVSKMHMYTTYMYTYICYVLHTYSMLLGLIKKGQGSPRSLQHAPHMP